MFLMALALRVGTSLAGSRSLVQFGIWRCVFGWLPPAWMGRTAGITTNGR